MVFVVNNYKSKNSYIIWILLLFCVRRLKSTLSFCLLNYFHNRTWYFAKIVVCKQVVYSLQYKRSSKQLNATSWTLLVLKLYGLGYICLVLLRPSNFHRHRGGWLPPNQHRHRGVLQRSFWVLFHENSPWVFYRAACSDSHLNAERHIQTPPALPLHVRFPTRAIRSERRSSCAAWTLLVAHAQPVSYTHLTLPTILRV